MAPDLQRVTELADKGMTLNVGSAIERSKGLGVVEVIDASLLDDQDISLVAKGNTNFHGTLMVILKTSVDIQTWLAPRQGPCQRILKPSRNL